jgi:hypothetical protein
VIYEATNAGAGVAASLLGIAAAAYAILLESSFYGSLHAATADYQRNMWLQRNRTPPAGNGLLAAVLINPAPPTLQNSASETMTVPIRSVAYNESSADVPVWLTATPARPAPEHHVATRLRDEIAAMPSPAEVVPALVELAGA